MTTLTGTAGTADTVHVIFRYVGQFKVHYLGQLLDIQTTGCDVRRHQHTHFAGLEVSQGAGAGTLRLVAVNGGGGNTVLLQLLGQAVGTVLGAGKDQHLFPAVVTNQLAQQSRLLALVHRVNRLFHLLGGGIAGRNLHLHRVIQQTFRKSTDLIGEGGREQQVLAPGRQQRKNLANVADKAHVQHAVGFIQHQNLHFVEAHSVLLVQVHQPARCCHQYVQTLAQLYHLRIDFHTTENHSGLGRNVFAVKIHAVVNLRRQLPGGRQNQGTGAFAGARVFTKALQQRQGETGGFAGAGLGGSHHIPAGKNGGDGLGLNWGRCFITLIGSGTDQLLGQTE